MKTFRFKKIDILFYLDKKLTPKNFSLEKFKIMINEYKIYKRIICMPDLHFKDKNFIPSGVNVPIKNTITIDVNIASPVLKVRYLKTFRKLYWSINPKIKL